MWIYKQSFASYAHMFTPTIKLKLKKFVYTHTHIISLRTNDNSIIKMYSSIFNVGIDGVG